MSLEADFVSNSIANALDAKTLAGIIDICPADASLLIRFNPDELAPAELERVVRSLEEQFADPLAKCLKREWVCCRFD